MRSPCAPVDLVIHVLGKQRCRILEPGMLTDNAVHFQSPPLNEVALSFQFRALTDFSYAEIGALREHFRDDFPRIEYQPALPPSFEIFGPPSVFQLPFPFPPIGMPRVWLLNDSGVEVLQFQPDRFTRNWRKAREDAEYPHYDHVRTAFLANVESLERFLGARQLGTIKPTQCELTYVNQIPAPDGYGKLMERAFTNWNDRNFAELGEVENVAFNTSYVLRTDKGEPIGRIYFQASSALDMLRNPVVQFMVIGRGAPRAQTIESATEFLDMVHDRIVKGFTEMTTPDIQASWSGAA